MTLLYIFTNNLRIKDNYSFKQFICEDNNDKIAIFILNENFVVNNKQKDYYLLALNSLKKELITNNIFLNIIENNFEVALKNISEKFNIERVFVSRLFNELDEIIINQFSFPKVVFFNDSYLIDLDKLKIEKNNISFTSFKLYLEKNGLLTNTDNEKIEKTNFLDKVNTNYVILESNYELPNETENNIYDIAEKKLIDFSNISHTYNENRNNLNNKHSHLSIYINSGVLSIKVIWKNINNSDDFRNELLWREYAAYMFFKFPNLYHENQFHKMNNFPWENNKEKIQMWKEGKTGYEIVDACMNQLNTTGYICNRARLIVSSFLVKNLLVHWKYGETYFAEKLVDYNKQNNHLNWQWVSNCGFNFSILRVFNCELQQKKFDKDGIFVLKWKDKANIISEKIVDIKTTSKQFKDLYYSIK